MERQTITVDIAPGNSQVERLGASQGDIGRPLGVYIIQNGVALDCSAYSAELYILKPDGKFYTTQATVDSTETNLIKWETAKQETPVAGACAAQIRITAGDDDIGTARFVEFVEASPGDMGSASESEVALLTEYVRQARESATSAGRDATTASGAASSASGSASTASTAASTATQAASAAAAAADRAEEVEESIPEDYSQLSDDVISLKSAFEQLDANVITESAGPSPIVSIADGADGMPMRKVEVAIEPVQEGEGDPSPENIRPITGWTGAKVTRCGKNLFDVEKCRSGTITVVDGVMTGTSTNFSRNFANENSLFAFDQDAGRVVLSFDAKTDANAGETGQGLSFIINYTDGSRTRINIPNSTTTYTRFTLASEANKIVSRINITYSSIGSNIWYLKDLQIELGSTATAYEPYQGQTYEVTFPTEAGTVYGGTLDVVTGKLVVDRAVVDMGTLEWIIDTTALSVPVFKVSVPNKRLGSADFISEVYKTVGSTRNALDTNNVAVAPWNSSTSPVIGLRDDSISTVEDLKAFLTGKKLVYLLQSTNEITLSQTEITTLLGINHVFADCGDTAITYPADTKMYIDRKITEAVANALNA